jgi:tetratricopeptide (TPR) repeat protein
VLELESGNLPAARSAFEQELRVLEGIASVNSKDAKLQAGIANTISYLGSVAEHRGDLPEALRRFAEQVRIYEKLVRDDPGTVFWQDRLANALALQAGVLAITGQRDAAAANRTRALALLAGLVARDASNRSLQLAALKMRLDEATQGRAAGDSARTQQLVDEARAGLERLAKIEPTDQRTAAHLAATWRLEAGLRAAAGRPDAAAAIAQAIALGDDLMAKERANDRHCGGLASACVEAGVIARKNGDDAAALRHWQRALEVAQSRGAGSLHWRLLDPAARALAFLGREDESRALVERLQRLGYQPLEPWPDATRPVSPAKHAGPPSK